MIASRYFFTDAQYRYTLDSRGVKCSKNRNTGWSRKSTTGDNRFFYCQ